MVSTDQLVNPTPGFVPIYRGCLISKRDIEATIFIDKYSYLTYYHLMTNDEIYTSPCVYLNFVHSSDVEDIPRVGILLLYYMKVDSCLDYNIKIRKRLVLMFIKSCMFILYIFV